MHVMVSVSCGDRRTRLRIALGDGKKSFKWLGLVAATRYCTDSPKGRCRARESGQRAAGTSFYPSQITTETCDFFHPDAIVCDYLADAAEVEVELVARQAVDAAGSPVKSRWSTIAFELSPNRDGKRETALRNEAEAHEAYVVAKNAKRTEERRVVVAGKAQGARKLVASQLSDPERVTAAMQEDWYMMASKGGVLSKMVPAVEEQAMVKEVFMRHFVELDELHKAFAGSGSSLASSHSMEFSEFAEFCHASKLAPEGASTVAILHSAYDESRGKLYDQAAFARKSFESAEEMNMERREFFVSILWFALFWAKPGTQQSLWHHGSSTRGLLDDDIDIDAHHSSRHLSSEEQVIPADGVHSHFKKVPVAPFRLLGNMITDRILPVLATKIPGAAGKLAMETDEVLALFADHGEVLFKIFSDRTDDDLTISDFIAIVEEAGMILSHHTEAGVMNGSRSGGESDGSFATLSNKDVRMAFSAAQSEATFVAFSAAPKNKKKKKIVVPAVRVAPAAEKQQAAADALLKSSEAKQHLTQMNFPEFLEALVRVGMTKWAESNLPTHERVERCLAMVVAKHRPDYKNLAALSSSDSNRQDALQKDRFLATPPCLLPPLVQATS